MSLRKNDILDNQIVDKFELISDGYSLNSIYFESPIINVVGPSKLITVGPSSDGNLLVYSKDHPLEIGDLVWISGSSFNLSDGYYSVSEVVSNNSFKVNEFINSSTGGIAQFRYRAGALNVGFDPRNTFNVTHNNVQEAIEDLDLAIAGSGGGGSCDCPNITSTKHPTLRQLIHLSDEIGGPFEKFSNAYREFVYSSNLPTTITWYEDSSKTNKLFEKQMVYSGITPTNFQRTSYENDGITPNCVALDALTYDNNFEDYRTRSIVDFPYPSIPLTSDSHKDLRQLVHLVDGVGGPFEGFDTLLFRETTPNSINPTSIVWYTDATKTNKIVEKFITYSSNMLPITFQWNVYDDDGETQLASVKDSLTYVGSFEHYRIRTIFYDENPIHFLSTEKHKFVRQLIHLADGVGGPFEGFVSEAYREINPVGPFPTSVTWYTNLSKTNKIVEKNMIYNPDFSIGTSIYKVYNIDGSTTLKTSTDSINYVGIFESNRTRIMS